MDFLEDYSGMLKVGLIPVLSATLLLEYLTKNILFSVIGILAMLTMVATVTYMDYVDIKEYLIVKSLFYIAVISSNVVFLVIANALFPKWIFFTKPFTPLMLMLGILITIFIVVSIVVNIIKYIQNR